MSDAESSSRAEADTRRHLAACLRMNPMWESEGVLESRANLLGLASNRPDPYAAAREQAAERAQTRELLQGIRSVIWLKPLDELRADLVRTDADRFPELQPVAERLRVIIDSRKRLEALADHKHFDGELLDCFKGVLSAAPAESAQLRERVATSFARRNLRRRGRRMLTLLEREVPELCAIEAAWIAQLRGQRGAGLLVHTPAAPTTFDGADHRSQSDSQHDRSGHASWGCGWVFLVWMVLQVLFGLLRSGFGDP